MVPISPSPSKKDSSGGIGKDFFVCLKGISEAKADKIQLEGKNFFLSFECTNISLSKHQSVSE